MGNVTNADNGRQPVTQPDQKREKEIGNQCEKNYPKVSEKFENEGEKLWIQQFDTSCNLSMIFPHLQHSACSIVTDQSMAIINEWRTVICERQVGYSSCCN